MRTVQVFEYDTLCTYPNNNGDFITHTQLDQLYRFNDLNGNKYFTGIRQGVKFNSFVGVIKVGTLTIEILPKVDKSKATNQNDVFYWRAVLIQMLRVCKKINIESVSDAVLTKKENSLLEIYINIFLEEVESLIRLGLIKKYRPETGNVNSWKGRMDFGRNIQNNLTHQERFFTHHQIYDYEHLLNQIIFKALFVLNSVVTNSSLKDRVLRNLMQFPEINQINILPEHFNKIIETRKTVPYRKALETAKMIILNYSPDVATGQENMIALMFDMNSLWEEYIYRMLMLIDSDENRIIYQDGKNFWEKRKIRPDFVIMHTDKIGNKSTFLIDTKWRVPENNQPTDDELKQMYAYNMYWEAKRSLLLYPEIITHQETFGKFHIGREGENVCKVGFISVFNKDGTLDYTIGKKILGKFED